MKTTMRKLFVFALALLLPVVSYAAVTGLPSRPYFQEVFLEGSSGKMWFGNQAKWQSFMAAGSKYSGGNWVATEIFAGIFGYDFASFKVYGDTGLVVGNNYTPTLRFSIDPGGFVTVTSTLTSTKACAAGYTRTGPNFCRATSGVTLTGLARDVCTSNTSLPSDAKAVLLNVAGFARSNNAVAARITQIYAYTTNACGTVLRFPINLQTYEFSAVVAGTIIATDSNEMIVPLDASQDFFLMLADDAGNQGTGGYSINGYFD